MSDQERPTDRPVKSYLERYNDIKDMLHTNNPNNGSSSSNSSSVYGSSNLRMESAHDSNNRQQYSRSSDEPVPVSSISSNMDDESVQTLERWESRKHRKLAEEGGKHPSSSSSSAVFSNPPLTDGNTRWVPRVDYRRKYASPEIIPKTNLHHESSSSRGVGDHSNSSPLFNDVELSPPPPPQQQYSHSKPNSSYADELQSFSNAISTSVAKEIAREYWTNPTVTFQQRQEAMRTRPDPTEEHCNDDDDADDALYHNDPDGEHYIGRRIKMNATTACCKRLSCHTEEEDVWQDPDARDNCFKPTWSSEDKKVNKWHVYGAILVCVGCVIATAFTVKYVSNGRDGGTSYYATGMTARPTVSTMPSQPPSIPPSGMPSDMPTNRPTSERDLLISEYLAEITDGVSNVEGSSQCKAKVWILHEDSLALSIPSYASDELIHAVKERIKQRYALATLYYAMGIGEGGVLKGWLEGDECRFVGDYDKAWDGVDCDEEGEVRALAIGKIHWLSPWQYFFLLSMLFIYLNIHYI